MFRRTDSGIALLPFLPAGYPTLDVTLASVGSLGGVSGVGAVEIGFPFSDPIADGPVIQQAFNVALSSGVRPRGIFDAVAALAGDHPPLVAMASYSIVFRYGLDRFCADARASGFAAVLMPDLPPPEAQAACGIVRAAGLETVLLVAPTTTPPRRAEIADLCSGFVYYLSVSGITGERTDLPADLRDNVRQLRSVAHTPVAVGFGISTAGHVRQLVGVADGAIVGSAVVRRMSRHVGEAPATVARAVADFARELLA